MHHMHHAQCTLVPLRKVMMRHEADESVRFFFSVIVATGILALVDDCIRRRWHHERRPSWILPAQHSLVKSLERMGPRRLIGQVLQRRGSA